MKTQFKKFLMVVAGLAWLDESNGEPGWRGQGGPWIDQGDRSGGMQSWGNKFEGGPPASHGFDQASRTGCSRCTVIQDNPSAGPSGPPGPEGGGGFAGGGGGGGSGGGAEKFPPGYRGNGYDNFSPEWKLREVLQQQGSGGAPVGQVAAGGWKKEKSNSVGQWSGTIRPIEPNWGEAAGPEPPPPPHVPPGGSGWGNEVKVSSQGWAVRGQSPRKIEETFRVTSAGGDNWISGGNGWNKGGSPEGPPSASYQGGGHGGYHEFDGSRVSGQSLNVQSGYQAWDTSHQDGWDNSGRSLSYPAGNYRQGGQEQAGLQGWGTGLGHSSSYEYGRPVEPQPQPPYTPREPDVKNPSNTDPRWGTRGPSWGFRDPPFGSESREPSWNRQNANWNKIASGSLSVSSGYGPDPASPQKESPWGSKGGGYPGQSSPWPLRGPPPMQYPSYGSSGRRPGVGCRDLGCSQAGFPRGPPQWGPSAPPSSSGGGSWGGYRDREPPPRQPSWKPSGGGGAYYGDRQPPSGASNGYQGYSPGGQGYPAGGSHGGYVQQNGPPPGQGYPPRGYSPQGRPPTNQGYPSNNRYNCPPTTPPSPAGCPPAGQQGPGASGYPPGGQGGPGASGYPPGGQGGPGASGYPPGGQGGAGASGYPPGGQGGPGASGYPPGGQGGPGASGYPPGGQGGPGASGYPPGGQGNPDCGSGPSNYPPETQTGPGAGGCPPAAQQFQDPHRRYNGHSGVGATLDFPGLNAYSHDTSKHGTFVHCGNHTDSDQHTHSSTAAPTSTSPP